MKSFIDLKHYIGSTDHSKAPAFLRQINNPVLHDPLGIDAEKIKTWKQQGLLWSEDQAEAYSFLACLWLKLIQKLESFGLNDEALLLVREQLQEQVEMSLYWFFQQPTGHASEDRMPSEIRYIEHLLLSCVFGKMQLSLLVRHDGLFMPFFPASVADYGKEEVALSMMQSSHLSISITEILSELFAEDAIDIQMPLLEAVSKDEKQMLDLLRQDGLVEVLVSYNSKNQIELVKTTKERPISLHDRFKDVVMYEGYQDISLTTQRGKVVKFRSTVKTKFR